MSVFCFSRSVPQFPSTGVQFGIRRLSLGPFILLGDDTHSLLTPRLKSVSAWANDFVIGKKLCPWAVRSKKSEQLYLVSSDAVCESEALSDVCAAAKALLSQPSPPNENYLGTTLLAFEERERFGSYNFEDFDSFVRRAQEYVPGTSLIAFHPHFNRWRDLPLIVGEKVQAHRLGTYVDPDAYAKAEQEAAGNENGVELDCIYRKTDETWAAIIVGVHEGTFGVRSARLLFLNTGVDKNDDDEEEEETVPIDWIVQRPGFEQAPLLADNIIHRSPVPVVHILRSDIVAKETENAGVDAIFDLQWRNAHLVRSSSAKHLKK